MAAITAAMVKELREATGSGMMDCKKALGATDGDMDKAVELLQKVFVQQQLQQMERAQQLLKLTPRQTSLLRMRSLLHLQMQ